MSLKSGNMRRLPQERHWLKWFGSVGKLKMRWSWLLNRHRAEAVEKTFEGIAQTRRRLLTRWAEQQWSFLADLAREIEQSWEQLSPAALEGARHLHKEASEIFVIDTNGLVLLSSDRSHQGERDVHPEACARGLKGPFLQGPFADPRTRALGPTTSTFHDDMTLLFIHPLQRDGEKIGCVCLRIPNDVMSDIIQREAGHVYRDSGDNYLFMVKSGFDASILAGTALSRSRFEDNAFTHGDNLKDGVRTDYGVVRVRERTELELRFTDPATRDLHPGVRETIANGQHVFVCYPGYPDYRHIPVIGAGLTFTMPGSADTWGLLCEGDLAEVYQERSIDLKLLFLLLVVGGAGGMFASYLPAWLQLSPAAGAIAQGVVLALVGLLYWSIGLLPHRQRLQQLGDFFLTISETGSSLQLRLEAEKFPRDETRQLALWINSFVDKLDDTVNQVVSTAGALNEASSTLTASSAVVNRSAQDQRVLAQDAQNIMDDISGSINQVADHSAQTEQASQDAHQISQQGDEIVSHAAKGMAGVAQSVRESAGIIQVLSQCAHQIDGISNSIRDIAEQTNLLALNAAIEAARAGEQGRGFAVVADEVRNLSHRTSQATHEIIRTVSVIQTETGKAVKAMDMCDDLAQQGVARADEASEALKHIQSGALSTLERVRTVTEAAFAQKKLAGQVGQQVRTMTQNASNSEQAVQDTLQTVHQLRQLVLTLQSATSKFNS